MLIGRYSERVCGFLTLGIGKMRLVFHSDGAVDVKMQWLMMSVKGETRYSAAGLMNFAGILSYPVEQSDLRLLIAFITSS